jgi:hypothetical protein
MKLKNYLRKFEWMKIYFSPFKPPKPKLYIGKTAVSTPFFYPRVWKKATHPRAIDAAIKRIEEIINHNKRNEYKLREQSFGELYNRYINSSFPQPKKIGFDVCNLGWKTKFDSFRFESNPVWSFVFFGYQIAITFVLENDMHSWEAYLAYEYDTDKSKSAEERIKQARKKHPNIWTRYDKGVKTTVDYWDLAIKKRYL